MASSSNTLFTQVRSKLRHPRSSTPLSSSDTGRNEPTHWDNVPVEFQPVERAEARVVQGYYLTQPLPGPPPRPRTVSPSAHIEQRTRSISGHLTGDSQRTYRRRSAQEAHTPWPDGYGNERDNRDKTMSVEVAIALPPEHLDPPPPYSLHPVPLSAAAPNRPRSQPAQNMQITYTYNPSDWVDHPVGDSRRFQQPVRQVPTIGVPEPPTPVSPINSLDIQYLAMRQRQASGGDTIDALLSHPMLQRPG